MVADTVELLIEDIFSFSAVLIVVAATFGFYHFAFCIL